MIITIFDYETFFSDDYTLSKETTESYVRNPRFEAHGCAVKWTPEQPAQWLSEPDWRYAVTQVDWSQRAVLCHHAQFDLLISSHHYNFRPRYILDTLSMARQQLGNHLSASLDNVRQHFGMPFKRTPYNKFKGKHWNELDPATQREVADGACDEVESIWRIFNLFAKDFPPEMYPWVDNTVRMFTEPKLVGDIGMLGQLWQQETAHKAQLLVKLGVTAKDLGSDEIFAGLLRQLGVEPEVKDTGKQVKYAFAKTDPQMQEMADDEDDDVRALVEARLSIKSTLQQTRSERLGFMASRGSMCVYLSAFGAHTNRDSGGDKVNWQNFTRSTNVREGAIDLRKTIKPPKGYLTAKVDKAQIECRILNMFAGQDDVIEKFRNKEDPYVGIASQFYGFQVTKVNEKERGTGKQLELSCGYGAGTDTIIATARKGTYGPPVYLTQEQGERAKALYRDTHPAVTDLWRDAGRMISAIGGTERPIAWGCVEVHTGAIIGPNGTRLRYPDLAYEEYEVKGQMEQGWRYTTRKGRAKLYGAKLVENCLSAATEVLTINGWRGITTVKKGDVVYDGHQWVMTDGCLERGIAETAWLDGVWLTAGHKVLTVNGWVRAAQTQGLHRAPVRASDSLARRWLHGAEKTVGVSMRLRKQNYIGQFVARAFALLRMPEGRTYLAGDAPSRNVAPSRFRGVARDARSVPSSYAPSVEKLRWSWDHSVQTVAAKFREFLGRHGTDVRSGTDFGAQEKQQRLHAEELYLGNVASAGAQPAWAPSDKYSVGSNDSSGSGPAFGAWGNNTTLSNYEWLARKAMVHPTSRLEPTFDLLNCGPRNRFVVRGKNAPFIVHNCIQWLAWIAFAQDICRIGKESGLWPVLREHDAGTWLIPDDQYAEQTLAYLKAEMSRPPAWMPDIPLDADAVLSERQS